MIKWLVALALAAIIGSAPLMQGTLMSSQSQSFPDIVKEVLGMNSMICRPLWLEQAHADLKRHEGFRPYAYPDPLSPLGQKHGSKFGYKPAREVLATLGADAKLDGGPWTVGYGFTGEDITKDSKMTQAEADDHLYTEIMSHSYGLNDLVPDWGNAPLYVQTVLVNLIFNMGKARLAKFTNSLKLFNEKKYQQASENLKKSLWYKQTGSRARELTARLSAGAIPSNFAVII